MFSLRNVTLQRGSAVLFKDADLTIFNRQKIGIIGANGTGKTSLFLLLLNQLHPDRGDVELGRQTTLGHVEQEAVKTSQTAIDYVLSGDRELMHLQEKLRQAEAKQDGESIALLHEKLDIIGGYSANARAGELLNGLGFLGEEQQKPVATFSGGWRVRLNLARALMSRSDILLLDEPTNHLDLDAVLWLQNWLKHYAGTLLIISHDRDFLDEVVDHIVHVSQQKLSLYKGNYSSFEKVYAESLMLQQAMYEKQQKKLAHLQKFVDRFRYKASKAKQAQSRLKAIDKMETVAKVQSQSLFQFEFYPPKGLSNPLIALHKARIQYNSHLVLDNINLNILPQARIAFVGPNGAGKSSLIKLIAGNLSLEFGQVERGKNLQVGYFAQHQVDTLQLQQSAYEHIKNLAEGETPETLRTFLGTFGFGADKVFQEVALFSGGEKARLALALLVWQKPNLLLLDEPTNHLDLEMRQALSLALQSYQGALILVTHDRFLLRTTVDELFLVANQKVTSFDGSLDDYQDWLLTHKRSEIKKDKGNDPKKQQRVSNARRREETKLQRAKIAKLEKEIGQMERRLKTIAEGLSTTEIYLNENKEKLQKLILEEAELKKNLQLKEEEWLSVQSLE